MCTCKKDSLRGNLMVLTRNCIFWNFVTMIFNRRSVPNDKKTNFWLTTDKETRLCAYAPLTFTDMNDLKEHLPTRRWFIYLEMT